MFDIGGTELLVIAIVAIVVVGPKDLPRMLRTVGQFVGKAKTMAREFQDHFNEAADQAGLDEVRKGITDATSGSSVSDALKPFTEVGDEIKREIEKPDLSGAATETSTDEWNEEFEALDEAPKASDDAGTAAVVETPPTVEPEPTADDSKTASS